MMAADIFEGIWSANFLRPMHISASFYKGASFGLQLELMHIGASFYTPNENRARRKSPQGVLFYRKCRSKSMRFGSAVHYVRIFAGLRERAIDRAVLAPHRLPDLASTDL